MFFPANSTYILQPNDQYVFGTFKLRLSAMSSLVEARFALLDISSAYVVGACIPYALQQITPKAVRASYEVIGLQPFDEQKLMQTIEHNLGHSSSGVVDEQPVDHDLTVVEKGAALLASMLRAATSMEASHVTSKATTRLKVGEFIDVKQYAERLSAGKEQQKQKETVRQVNKRQKLEREEARRLLQLAKQREIEDDIKAARATITECDMRDVARILSSYCINCRAPTSNKNLMCDHCETAMACDSPKCQQILMLHEATCASSPPLSTEVRGQCNLFTQMTESNKKSA